MTVTLDTEQVSCLIQVLMRHCRHEQLSVIKEFCDITGVGLEEAMRLIQAASREWKAKTEREIEEMMKKERRI
jgi:ribosomal protein L7/L12